MFCKLKKVLGWHCSILLYRSNTGSHYYSFFVFCFLSTDFGKKYNGRCWKLSAAGILLRKCENKIKYHDRDLASDASLARVENLVLVASSRILEYHYLNNNSQFILKDLINRIFAVRKTQPTNFQRTTVVSKIFRSIIQLQQ